jgi:hypothetical protein
VNTGKRSLRSDNSLNSIKIIKKTTNMPLNYKNDVKIKLAESKLAINSLNRNDDIDLLKDDFNDYIEEKDILDI